MARNLAGPELRRLQDALLSAFRSVQELERLASYGLNVDLHDIANTTWDLSYVAFQLVDWAIRRGQLDALVAAAIRENPGDPALRRFQREVWEVAAEGWETPPPSSPTPAKAANTTSRATEYVVNRAVLRVITSDITQVAADAVVSADDIRLSMSGGVAKALRRAAGEAVKREADALAPVAAGDVAVTSAGRLQASYIFHAATVDFDRGTLADEAVVRAATLKSMQLADRHLVRQIAFPALGAGVGRLDQATVARAMVETISEYLRGETQVETVIIVLFEGGAGGPQSARMREVQARYERTVALAATASQNKALSGALQAIEHTPGVSTEIAQQVAAMAPTLSQAEDAHGASSSTAPSQCLPPNENLEQITALLAELNSAFKQSGLDTAILDPMMEGHRQALGSLLNMRVLAVQELTLERERLSLRGLAAPKQIDARILALHEEITETGRQLMSVAHRGVRAVGGRSSAGANDRPASRPVELRVSDFHGHLVKTIVRLPVTDVFEGRSQLLLGLEHGGFNRSGDNKVLDLSMIVSQVLALGRLADDSRPIDIVIRNALLFATPGTAVADDLQVLLKTGLVEA